MYWVVLANTNLYRIYQFDKKAKQLSLLKENAHPENKHKLGDFITDRPGHYATPSMARGTYTAHSNPKEDEIDHFLKSLATECNTGRATNQYEKVILIAAPQVNGILSKHFDKHTEQLVCNHIKKDYTHLTEYEFHQYLMDNWQELIA